MSKKDRARRNRKAARKAKEKAKAEYMKQLQDSEEGSDVTDDGGVPTIVPTLDDRMRYYSVKAVNAYNDQEGSDYTAKVVLNAFHEVAGGLMYYITFQAISSEGDIQVFQAKVHESPDNLRIELVRPEPPTGSSFQDTEGFDADVCNTGDGGAPIVPMFDHMSQANYAFGLRYYSIKALHAYNDREGTNYCIEKVIKANSQATVDRMYYITFESINSKDHTQVFDVLVHQRHPNGSEKISLFRPESHFNSIRRLVEYRNPLQDTEATGFDVDVRITDDGRPTTIIHLCDDMSLANYDDRLRYYYSMKAVHDYNDREGSDYTVKEVVHEVEVWGGTHFITFRAINSEDHIQVFQAQVHQSLEKAREQNLLVRFEPPTGSSFHNRIIRVGTKAEYMKQLQDSEGFDVDVCITDDGGATTIVPMFHDMSLANYADALCYYSIKALHTYNDRKGSDYTVVTKVVKACNQAVFGLLYYITFEAMNSEYHTQVFQAKVHQHPNGSEEIVLVRPKPPTGSSFYNRIIGHGYGPEDGYELDSVAAWRIYFDRMDKRKLYHLKSKVFADDIPKEWRSKTIHLEWLEGVDKDVTSRSKAFACCPDYQYMWQNGYGPPDGENLDLKGWGNYEAEMTEDERKKMDNALFFIPDDDKIWKTYFTQVEESQGFDVDVYLKRACGAITPMFYNNMSEAKNGDDLICYSRKALVEYNKKNCTAYTVKEVVKACHQAVDGFMYYITFQASNSEGVIKVFQAQVHTWNSKVKKIELVRIKPENA